MASIFLIRPRQTDTTYAGRLPFPSLVFLQPALGAGNMHDFGSSSLSGQHWQRWMAGGEGSRGTHSFQALPDVSTKGCVLRLKSTSAVGYAFPYGDHRGVANDSFPLSFRPQVGRVLHYGYPWRADLFSAVPPKPCPHLHQ